MDPTPGARRPRHREQLGGAPAGARCSPAYGEEPNARVIAREIVRRRERAPIETTGELVAAVEAALPAAVRRRFGGEFPCQARVPSHPHRGERRAGRPRPGAARGVVAPAARAGGWPRSRSTRSRTGASSASWPTARAAASARPTCRCAAVAARPRPSCSPAARWRPTPGEVADNPRSASARLRVARRIADGEGLMAAAPHAAAHRRAPPPRAAPAAAPRRPGARAARPSRAPAAPARCVLDRLLSGRGWIGLVFLLLAGIVFFNVDLLRMNRDIAATADAQAAVKRENARLRGDLARLGSSERIQTVAAQAGLVLPAPGEVRYLHATPAPTPARGQAHRPRQATGAPGSARGAAGAGPARPAAAPEARRRRRRARASRAGRAGPAEPATPAAPPAPSAGAVAPVDPARPPDRTPLRRLPPAPRPGRGARRLARHGEGRLAHGARGHPAGRGPRGAARAAARSPTAGAWSWPCPRTPPPCSPTRC